MSSIFGMVKRKVALAFADTSSHGNSDDGKTTARRSRRTGNALKKSDPSNVSDSESDDGIDFVGEMPMARSGAATAVRAEPSQRQHQRLEAKTQSKQGAEQRHEDDLRQREEEDLKRAIELSKLDMEEEKSLSDSEDEWITGIESPLEPKQHFDKNQTPQLARKSLSNKGSRAGDGPSKGHGFNEGKLQTLSSTSSSSSGDSTSEEMEPASQEHANEWQDWEDPSQQQGVDIGDRGSPSVCMKRNDSVERGGKINNSQGETGRHQYAEEMRPTEDSPHQPRNRLRLRKRPVQDEGSSQHGQPSKARKVPSPPDVDESEDDSGDRQSPEEIDMTKEEEGSSEEGEDTPEEREEGRQDLEIIELVDTRKPRHPKHPYYAPLKSSKSTYTKVVYKLIQAYFSRLRRAQTKVLTRVSRGLPAVTGNCFNDALVFRKRGSRGEAFYGLSDSDEEEMGVADDQEKEGTSDAPAKTRLARRKKKIIFDDDVDSDFESFVPVRQSRLSTKGRRKLSVPDVLEMMLETKSQRLREQEAGGAVPDHEETLSQTLVQDQSQTQDYCPIQMEASEYDSDKSQLMIRKACTSQPSPSANGRSLSPRCRAGADSQSSINDIFEVSTNDDDTDDRQASESPSKNTDGMQYRRTSSQDSEEDDDVDSFDERLMSFTSLNTSGQPPKAVTPTVKNLSQSSNRPTSQELLSPDHSKTRSSQLEEHERDGFSGNSVISSVPADSSQHCEPSQEPSESRDKEAKVEGYDAHGLSFEEKRLIYHGELSASSKPNAADEIKTSGQEELPEDGEDDGASEEVQETSQSKDDKNKQSANPENFFRGQRTQQPEPTSRATNNGGSQPPEGQQLPANNPSALRPRRASVESTKQKVGRSKTGRFNVDEESAEDGDSEEKEIDRGEVEGVQEEDGVEAEEEEVRDGGDDDADSDETCLDEQEDIGDVISEPPQDDQIEDGQNEDDQNEDDQIEDGQNEDDQNEDDQNEDDQNEDDQNEDDLIEGDRTDAVGEGLHEDDNEEEVAFAEGGDVEDEVGEIGMECPLCGVQFPLDRIEAHASGCNGPVSPAPPPKENSRQEDEDSDSQEVPVSRRGIRHHPTRKGLVGSLNDSNALGDDAAPGPSTALEPKRRIQVRNTAEGGRPVRGIATKIVKENPSGSMSRRQEFTSSRRPPDEQRSTPISDEENSESFSESNDHLNASLFQLVEDNNLYRRKRKRVQERPAKRQRFQDVNKREDTSSVEDTERCFLCNKRIPKSLYAQHVQDEMDRAEEADHSQEAVQPKRGLRSKKATGKAAGGETSTDNDMFQSGPSNDVGDLIEDFPSGDWEQDSESDGSLSATDDPILDPMVSESPIKAFRPISKQPMNLINFQNQFQSKASGSRKRRRSTTSSKRGRGGQASRGGGGGRKQRGKKRRRFPRKNKQV